MLGRERDNRRRSAKRGGYGAAVKIVCAHDAHARHLFDMAVAVYPAGQHQLTRGVDFAGPRIQPLSQRRDLAVAHAYIAGYAVRCRDDFTASNDQIISRHQLPPEIQQRAVTLTTSRLLHKGFALLKQRYLSLKEGAVLIGALMNDTLPAPPADSYHRFLDYKVVERDEGFVRLEIPGRSASPSPAGALFYFSSGAAGLFTVLSLPTNSVPESA